MATAWSVLPTQNLVSALYSQDGKKADAVVVAKYFFPATALTWYVTEGRKEDDDYLFFGLVVGTDTTAEMGYFSLSQLSELNVCGREER